MVSPAANWRSDKPPTIDNFEAYKGEQALPDPLPGGPATKDPEDLKMNNLLETDAQLRFLGNPERVQVLDPVAYQTAANSNKIAGDIAVRRTTFY